MLFGQTHSDWTEVDHPEFGKVLVGGGTKYSRRTPPPFMLEEEAHRNFAFTMFHASEMPVASPQRASRDGSRRRRLAGRSGDRQRPDLIPTRVASRGCERDRFARLPESSCPATEPKVLLAGPDDGIGSRRRSIPSSFRPANGFSVEDGIQGRSISTFRYLLASDGPPSGTFQLRGHEGVPISPSPSKSRVE